MVRLRHADLRIGAGAAFARQLKGDDAGHVGAQREHLQVEHQLDVIFPLFGHAGRTLRASAARRLAVLLLGLLDAALDLADRVEVFVDA